MSDAARRSWYSRFTGSLEIYWDGGVTRYRFSLFNNQDTYQMYTFSLKHFKHCFDNLERFSMTQRLLFPYLQHHPSLNQNLVIFIPSLCSHNIWKECSFTLNIVFCQKLPFKWLYKIKSNITSFSDSLCSCQLLIALLISYQYLNLFWKFILLVRYLQSQKQA